jgi:hypothetical protein
VRRTWPFAARAQQKNRVYRIVALLGGSTANATEVDLIEKVFKGLGWSPGQDLEIVYRWGAGDTELNKAYAKEIIGMKPDAILAGTNTAMAALHREASAIPTVFVMVSDPVGMHYVDSFAHPGGNVTGFTPFAPSLGSKWVSLILVVDQGRVISAPVLEGPRDYSQGKGAIRAFGEHKGSGLAFICELLGGALTGTGATGPDRRFANGMFAVYVDPKVVDTGNFFDGEISRYVDFIRATKPVAGVDAVLIPGDPERKMRADRTKNGVPLPDDTWAAIVNTAREVGVSEVSIQRAVS